MEEKGGFCWDLWNQCLKVKSLEGKGRISSFVGVFFFGKSISPCSRFNTLFCAPRLSFTPSPFLNLPPLDPICTSTSRHLASTCLPVLHNSQHMKCQKRVWKTNMLSMCLSNFYGEEGGEGADRFDPLAKRFHITFLPILCDLILVRAQLDWAALPKRIGTCYSLRCFGLGPGQRTLTTKASLSLQQRWAGWGAQSLGEYCSSCL